MMIKKRSYLIYVSIIIILLITVVVKWPRRSKKVKPKKKIRIIKNDDEIPFLEEEEDYWTKPIIMRIEPLDNSGSGFSLRLFRTKSPGTGMDAKIFKDVLYERFKVTSEVVRDNFKDLVDVNFFIENSDPKAVKRAKHNWMLANQELVRASSFENDTIHTIFCRHHLCTQMMRKFAFVLNLTYEIIPLKFTSRETGIEGNLTDKRFVHLAGKSPFKNTRDLIATWKKYPTLPDLFITCFDACFRKNFKKKKDVVDIMEKHPNIKIYAKECDHNQIKKLHAIPFVIGTSAVEGYGHYINEARASKKIVITLNIPPHNEIIKEDYGYLLTPQPSRPRLGAAGCPTFTFHPDELIETVHKILQLNDEQLRMKGELARSAFVHDRIHFANTFAGFVRRFGETHYNWTKSL